MKLITEQIAKMDETLVLSGVVYDDIKIELTDHIASEIEKNIGENDILFEEAFINAFDNWKEQLRPSSSKWLGSKNVAPRIVIDKMILNSKKLISIAIVFVFITTIVLTALVRNFNNEIAIENIRMTLRIVFLLELFFIVFCKYLIWKSKSVTSFVFIYKKLNFSALGLLFLLGIGLMPLMRTKVDLEINLSSNFLTSIYFIWPICYIRLAYNHFQFERKFSKV